jgi:hypothetical protein
MVTIVPLIRNVTKKASSGAAVDELKGDCPVWWCVYLGVSTFASTATGAVNDNQLNLPKDARHLRDGLSHPGGVNHVSGTLCKGRVRPLI